MTRALEPGAMRIRNRQIQGYARTITVCSIRCVLRTGSIGLGRIRKLAIALQRIEALKKGRCGSGFIAHRCVMKCADSIPLYRLATQYERVGIPMTRQTRPTSPC